MNKIFSVEKIIAEKKIGFYPNLPQPFKSVIKSILYEKQVNKLLNEFRDEKDLAFINKILNYFNLSISTHFHSPLEKLKRCIFVCNHPTGIIDGLIVMNILNKAYPTQMITNDILDFVPNIKNLILPVDWLGTINKKQTRSLINAFHSDKHIIIFPAGEVSKFRNFTIEDLDWNPSFIKKAIQFQRDVIPVRISGRNSILFYAVSNLRRFLKMDFNIEIFLLIREIFNKKNNSINVKFGSPISFKTLNRNKMNSETNRIKNITYSI